MAPYEERDEHGRYRSKTTPIDPGISNVIRSLIPAALRRLSEDENFIWSRELGQFMVNVPDGDQDRWYSRTPSSGIRRNLDDKDSEDLDTAYWLSQAIHFGLAPSTSQDVIKGQLRNELQERNGRLIVPVRLLMLSYILQDKAEDDEVTEYQPVVKEEAKSETDEESDEGSNKDLDEDGDGDSDEDSDKNSEEYSNKSSDKGSDYEGNQALESRRSQRLPRHADYPVPSIENTKDCSKISSQPSDGRNGSVEDDSENSCAESTPTASSSRKGRTDHNRQKRGRKSLAQESRTQFQIEAGLPSSTLNRSKRSKSRPPLSIAIPDHLSDASEYLTAPSSSTSSPRTSRVTGSAKNDQILTHRSPRSVQVEKTRQMGAELSKEASSGEVAGDKAAKYSHEPRRKPVAAEIGIPSPQPEHPSFSRATSERGIIDQALSAAHNIQQIAGSQSSTPILASQPDRSKTGSKTQKLSKLASTSHRPPSDALTSEQVNPDGDFDIDELDEEGQLRLAIKLSKISSQPARPLSATVDPARTRTWQQYLGGKQHAPPYQIAPLGWVPDDRAFPEMEYIMQEIKSRMLDGLHGNDNIKFCIQLAAGDPETSYWNYTDAARVKLVDPRPMSIYHRWKPGFLDYRYSLGPSPPFVPRDTVVRSGSTTNNPAGSSKNDLLASTKDDSHTSRPIVTTYHRGSRAPDFASSSRPSIPTSSSNVRAASCQHHDGRLPSATNRNRNERSSGTSPAYGGTGDQVQPFIQLSSTDQALGTPKDTDVVPQKQQTVLPAKAILGSVATEFSNGVKSSSSVSQKPETASKGGKPHTGKTVEVHNSRSVVSSKPTDALRTGSHRAFDSSQIRTWIPQDYMDMGVVYHAKKAEDGYLVRTHDGVLQDLFPQNAYNNGQMRLLQQEKQMRGLMVIPPRHGFEAKAKKGEELRNRIGRKSAASVILKPDKEVSTIPLPKGPQGNVSYNGHSTNPWQLLAIGAVLQDSNAPVSSNTEAGEIEPASNIPEPRSSQSSSNAASISQSVKYDQLATVQQGGADPGVQDESLATKASKKTKSLSKAVKKELKKSRHSEGVKEVVEKDENGKSWKRKHADEVNEQAEVMDGFRKKFKKRKTDASAEAVAADPGTSEAAVSLITASFQHTTRDSKLKSGSGSTSSLPADVTQQQPTPRPSKADGSGVEAQDGKASSQTQPASFNTSAASGNDQGGWTCGWVGCDREPLETVTLLHGHVRIVHVGYKANANENLTCGWQDCSRTSASNQCAVKHIVQHVPFKSHVCSLCGEGYNRHDRLLKHVADEHSGDVLSGQGSAVPGSSHPATTTSIEQTKTKDAPAATRSPTDPDVEMRDVDEGEVIQQEHDSSSEASAEQERDSDGDEQVHEKDMVSGDDGEQEDDAGGSIQENTNMEIEVKMPKTTSLKQPFPQQLLPDKVFRNNYYEFDEESKLAQKKRYVNRLHAKSKPGREERPTLARAIRTRDNWQTVVDGIHSGMMESVADMQLRLARQKRRDLRVKIEAPGHRDDDVETLKKQLAMARRKAKDAKTHIKRKLAAQDLADQVVEKEKSEKKSSKDEKGTNKPSTESKSKKRDKKSRE